MRWAQGLELSHDLIHRRKPSVPRLSGLRRSFDGYRCRHHTCANRSVHTRVSFDLRVIPASAVGDTPPSRIGEYACAFMPLKRAPSAAQATTPCDVPVGGGVTPRDCPPRTEASLSPPMDALPCVHQTVSGRLLRWLAVALQVGVGVRAVLVRRPMHLGPAAAAAAALTLGFAVRTMFRWPVRL